MTTDHTPPADRAAHPCNAATMHRLGNLATAHGPHLWVVQPGMDPVRCPGTPQEQKAAPPADRAAPTDWIDRHPQLEAIAAAVWEQCGRSDSGMCVEDDPRSIAVAALAAVLPPPVSRADVLRKAADRIDREDLPQDQVDMFDNGARWATKLLRRMADEAQPGTEAAS